MHLSPTALLAACLATALIAPEGAAQIRRRDADPERGNRIDLENSIFSALASDEIPTEPAPGAEELAGALGLVPHRVKNDIQYYRHERTGMEFVFVPAGEFRFGSDYSDIWNRQQVMESLRAANIDMTELDVEQPQKPTWLSPYFIGAYEVTNEEYGAFLEAFQAGTAGDCEFPLAPDNLDHLPFQWGKRPDFHGPRQPVTGLGWFDAWAFCSWMGGRLPTEAEWEKAARGTDGRVFPWGNRFDPMRANTNASLNGRPLNVGTYEGGRSPYGCYDMAGNVAELTTEPWEKTSYRHRSAKDPALLERLPLIPFRVARGGSWNQFGGLYRARVTHRERAQILPAIPGASTSPSTCSSASGSS